MKLSTCFEGTNNLEYITYADFNTNIYQLPDVFKNCDQDMFRPKLDMLFPGPGIGILKGKLNPGVELLGPCMLKAETQKM